MPGTPNNWWRHDHGYQMKYDTSGLARHAPDLMCHISSGNPDHDVSSYYESLALKRLIRKYKTKHLMFVVHIQFLFFPGLPDEIWHIRHDAPTLHIWCVSSGNPDYGVSNCFVCWLCFCRFIYIILLSVLYFRIWINILNLWELTSFRFYFSFDVFQYYVVINYNHCLEKTTIIINSNNNNNSFVSVWVC